MDKGQKDSVEFIIAGENAAKTFDAAKKPFNLIALFVQLLIIVPRIFAIAFRRNYGYIAKLHSQSSGLIPFIGSIHQEVNRMVSWTELPQKGSAFRTIAAVASRQREYYPISIRCGDHMKFGVPSAPCSPDGLCAVFFKAPIPSG